MQTSIPSLLPPNLPRTMPRLEELYIVSTDQCADGQPLPYCSSLRRLSIVSFAAQLLPRSHHTAEDLQRQLPNINNLYIKDSVLSTCVHAMVQAWGRQLTRISFDFKGVSQPNLQHCPRLQSLLLKSVAQEPEASLQHLPSSLGELSLLYTISESDLEIILQLPLLHKVRISRFNNGLQTDWSSFPCTWHQLKIFELQMVDLSKLPLHSLREDGCLRVVDLELPDPLHPNSLANVKHAAQCISNAGITIQDVNSLKCTLWSRPPEDSAADAASAELLRTACTVVKKSDGRCTLKGNAVAHYPQTVTAFEGVAST